GENAVIEISDTGCGIPEEQSERIFDPFYTSKDVGQGTGQGLTIAYDIIANKHQGSIDFTSTVNEGTTFTITIPKQASCETTVN
ncbi:MAG: ATP-binding protein, partial [Proteobacteria bacterium]|nr:ATP-binding protein [Pseudomonadota bacterium]